VAIASDYIIIPTELESFSALEGLPDSLLHLENARTAMAERGLAVSRIVGIIPSKMRDTQMHKNILAHLHDTYAELVWAPVKQAVIYSEAQAARKLLYAVAPDAKATASMWNIVQRIIAIPAEA
jgi:cellulose biosynthesis protein BcsQ